ncbi:TPA: hypothetical protein ACP9DH_003314 [Legionella anisa]
MYLLSQEKDKSLNLSLTVHLVVAPNVEAEPIRVNVQNILLSQFKIRYTTLQTEHKKILDEEGLCGCPTDDTSNETAH